MSDIFFEELDLPPPTYNLQINSLEHRAMTGRMLEKLEEVMLAEKADAVLIYGDTNSTAAGALAAAKLHIPVIHVEAGTRSFNRRVPEEINRIVADRLGTLLLCPTHTAVDNLAKEGITDEVYAVGDMMYDTTLAAIERAKGGSLILETRQLTKRFTKMVHWLEQKSRRTPIVLTVPTRTRKLIAPLAKKLDSIRLPDPLGYLDIIQLVHHSIALFTDSEELQKEVYFHSILCDRNHSIAQPSANQ